MIRPVAPLVQRFLRLGSVALTAVGLTLLGLTPAHADTILTGTPVTGATSTQNAAPSGFFDGEWIKYYIPLKDSTSGTYGNDLALPGTNLAGTIVDTGDGGSWLSMFIMFAPLPDDITSAALRFEFKDLDLRYVNDPAGFVETIEVFNSSSSRSFTGGQLTKATSSATAGYTGSGSTRVDWDLSWTAGNSNAPVYLDLWGAGLLPYVTDIEAFRVKLKFTVPDGVPYGTNTPEYLKATLKVATAPQTVPEPTSLLLLGLGIVAVTARRRLVI